MRTVVATLLLGLLSGCVDREAIIASGLDQSSTQTIEGDQFEVFHNTKSVQVFYVPKNGFEIESKDTAQGIERFTRARQAAAAASGCAIVEFIPVPARVGWQGSLRCDGLPQASGAQSAVTGS